ncbi:MAG: Wadjet anti-phage system protein JetD domain-containing protein [Mediterraneibacter gnavus]
MTWILGNIVKQIESGTESWRAESQGGKSLSNEHGELYDKKHLKSDVVQEAEQLQHKNLIQIKWADGYRGSDIERIRYRLEDKEKFYALYQQEVDAEFLPKQEKIRLYQEFLRNQLAQVKKLWIRAYYQDLLERSENKRKKDLLELLADEKKYAPCFEGLDQLTESVFKRIFSKKYLGNTKTFEQEMQSHVISTAKKFCPDVEKEMDDTTVLQQLWIEEYAQELSLKGKLHFCLKEENGSTQEINTECYRFGTTLNSQTLEHAEIKEVQNIQKIVIFENKANYISAPYKDGILYLFSHGYFSPKECRFLKQLHQVLKNQTSCEVQYFHSGDLDYGGIKIFQYIRKTIFPELEPIQMDVETYEAYQEFTEVIDPETLEKLKRVQDENPKLQELIKRLIETGKGIEQECFLIEKRGNHI